MQLFYLTRPSAEQGELNAIETRHCVKVLRHRIGDIIHAIDGQGNMYRARISQIYKDRTDLELLESRQNWGEHGKTLRLIVSPLRLKDRFEWLIEKAVELGVTEIFPIQCQRTDPYKSKFKPERIQTLMLTALKQCKRSRLPTLHPLQSLTSFLEQEREGPSFLAYCEAQSQMTHHQPKIVATSQLSILIGPEGDFTEEEVQQAQHQACFPVLLGDQRLRTETAALFALSQVKTYWGY
ncbi:MAG: RsmE family RNA methyltransferase [Bacteroidota bacterium]